MASLSALQDKFSFGDCLFGESQKVAKQIQQINGVLLQADLFYMYLRQAAVSVELG
jgi:hypothetical protein